MACELADHAALGIAAVAALGTVVSAVFTWLAYRVYVRTAWLTGAMETHSELQLALKARELGVKMIWWDPTLADVPTVKRHRSERKVDEIYCYLPLKLRAGSAGSATRRS